MAPGFRDSVIWHELLAPPDIEQILNMKGGNIFHGSMGLNSIYFNRPTASMSGYKTFLENLYICGSSAHPGGGVMGAPGRNCAKVILKS